MGRIAENWNIQTAMAPASVSATTATTSGYVDASGAEEVAFIVSTAPLGAGKTLTVTLMGANDSAGDGAAAIGDAVTFTDAVGTEPQAAVVSYRVDPQKARYLAVKFQHDGAAAVICSVAAASKSIYRPAKNPWAVLM